MNTEDHIKDRLSIKSGKSILTISTRTGAVKSLSYQGNETLSPSSELFSMRFIDGDGDHVHVRSKEFNGFKIIEKTDCYILSYSQLDVFPKLKVKIRLKAINGFFKFRPEVCEIPEDLLLELIDVPHIFIKPESELFWPKSEGCIISKQEKCNRRFKQLDFPDNCGLGYYPGVCQMQFMASYSSEAGLYFAADDYTHATKVIEFSGADDEQIRLRIECCCGTDNGQKEYLSPFDIVLGGFQGDWMDACSIYREWAVKDPGLERKFPLPDWMDKSPVVIVYPVRGSGTIQDTPNNFVPYENAFPVLKELSDKFDAPVMALLMRWDQHGPWLPPYYWPPVGGVESFLKFRDLLHESGNLLGVYGSGTAFTVKSKINDYSNEEKAEQEGLKKYMACGRKGELDAVICDIIREGWEICISEKWGQDVIREQVKKVAEAGVDFFQIFDQNLGCASFLCYSKEHSHPTIPGAWQTTAMQSLIDRLNDDIRKTGSEMILGTECAAAGPYVSGLPFNDMRDVFCMDLGRPVPAYQFVYHRYANNFLGNQCEAYKKIHCYESPDNLLFRIAQGFSAGEFLTIAIRDSGEIDWGVATDWKQPAPEQEPAIILVRNLNKLRLQYPEFLCKGEMQKTFCQLKTGKYKLTYKTGVIEYPSILDSSWTAPDGSMAQFLVNFLDKEQDVEITVPNGIQVELNGGFIEEGTNIIKLAPLSAVVLKVRKTYLRIV